MVKAVDVSNKKLYHVKRVMYKKVVYKTSLQKLLQISVIVVNLKMKYFEYFLKGLKLSKKFYNLFSLLKCLSG